MNDNSITITFSIFAIPHQVKIQTIYDTSRSDQTLKVNVNNQQLF